MSTYTKQELGHAEQKVAEWEAKGNAEKPGTASQQEAWGQARKWKRTLETIRGHLA